MNRNFETRYFEDCDTFSNGTLNVDTYFANNVCSRTKNYRFSVRKAIHKINAQGRELGHPIMRKIRSVASNVIDWSTGQQSFGYTLVHQCIHVNQKCFPELLRGKVWPIVQLSVIYVLHGSIKCN